ncbi:putative reverse transcriptase domain-containing protein [Tanacetum coccineum]
MRVREEDIPMTASEIVMAITISVYAVWIDNCNAVFMDLMNRVCKPYLDKFVIVFIDDILIYSKNKQEHEEHLKIILELLKKEELEKSDLLCITPVGRFYEKNIQLMIWTWCSGSLLRSGDIFYMERELLCDYDCDIRYHSGKANVVADALSRKEREPPLRVRALTAIREHKVGNHVRMEPCLNAEGGYLVMAICGFVIPMEFQVGDTVMLKVSPWKGVVRFGNGGGREVKPVKAKPDPISQGSMELQEMVLSSLGEREDQMQDEITHTSSTKTASSSKCCNVAFDLLRDAVSAIFGLSELKGIQYARGTSLDLLLLLWKARIPFEAEVTKEGLYGESYKLETSHEMLEGVLEATAKRETKR